MNLFLQGVIIGFVVAVPIGPIGLLCVNRALSSGATAGLFSGLGVATADAMAAGIAALGLTLIADFLIGHQVWLRFLVGLFLCYLGFRIFTTKLARPIAEVGGESALGGCASAFLLTFSNPVTLLSFMAIYAGWGVESLKGNYLAAAYLTSGVFAGSFLWWVMLAIALLLFQRSFTDRGVTWARRVSGVIIAGFGFFILLGR